MPRTSAPAKDPYVVLGVSPTDDQREIERAYRRLCRQFHPDVNRAPEAGVRMREINLAYGVLRDPAQRSAYDRTRVAVVPNAVAWAAAKRAWKEAARTPPPPRPQPKSAPPPPPTAARLVVTPHPIDFGLLRQGETASRCVVVRTTDGSPIDARAMTRGDWLRVDRTEVFGRVAVLNVTADPSELHGFWTAAGNESAMIDGALELVDKCGSLRVSARVILRRESASRAWWNPFAKVS